MAKGQNRDATHFLQGENLELLTFDEINSRWGIGKDVLSDLGEAGLTITTASNGESAKKLVFKDHLFSILRQKSELEGQNNVFDPEKFQAARDNRNQNKSRGKAK